MEYNASVKNKELDAHIETDGSSKLFKEKSSKMKYSAIN